METDRQRKRDSARKKRDFSVYSQKAVRATELRWTKEQHVVQKTCLAKAKGDQKKVQSNK